MKKLLDQFKTEKSDHKNVVLEFLFDFAIVALVSLIFSGFIINNKSAPFDQKLFMVGNAALLSIHWYVHIFFKQRYAKRNSFHRVWVFFKIIGMLIMAIGIDLMAFRKNQIPADQDFLRWFSMIIFLVGFIFSRFITMISYVLAVIANWKDKAIVKMGIFKAVSRSMTILLAIIHLYLILIYKNDVIAIATYVFMPLYLIIEFLGNVINVTDKNLKKAPEISIDHAKERFSKFNQLYIASFFVAGTIQFAYYFHNANDFNMLGSLFGVYIIGFLIWWSYIDRVYKFQMKGKAKSLLIYSFVNIFMSIGLILMGSMLINSHSSQDHKFIPPTIFFGFVVYIISYWLTEFTFAEGKGKWEINNSLFVHFTLQYASVIFLGLIFGIISIFFKMPMYGTYIILISLFLILNITNAISRTKKNIK